MRLTLGLPFATTPPDGLDLALETVRRLYAQFLAALPLVGVAVVVGIVGIVVALVLAAGVRRAVARTGADAVAVRLLGRIVRLLAIVSAILLALSVAGVPVGAALAGLGLAGLAVAFAFQGILENFIAGVILLARRPFRAGDQIRTNDLEGTVEEIDLRVTRLLDYDGTLVLVPNADVFKAPLVNLTRRGSRRTCVLVSVDYRDDHDLARGVLKRAVAAVEGVLEEPAPEVLLAELGDSSVDFEVYYWTAPTMADVRYVRDRVLAACKRAIEDAGMTIPWPIRTLVLDSPVELADRP